MTKMSKTAALREAQAACGKPSGARTSWVCYVPYYDDQPSGPTTELRADSYPKIVQRRAQKVAAIALALMGAEDYGCAAEMAADRAIGYGGSIRAKAIVEAVINA